MGENPLAPPPLDRPGRGQEEHRLSQDNVHRGAETHYGKILGWNLEEGQAAVKVARHQMRLKAPAIRQAHAKTVCPDHHIVYRQEISPGIHNDPGASPLSPQDHRGGMARLDRRLDTDHGGEDPIDQLGWRIHDGTPQDDDLGRLSYQLPPWMPKEKPSPPSPM